MAKGFVSKFGKKIEQATVNTIGKIYPNVYEKYAPDLKCGCCGTIFKYRGIRDASALGGLNYNFDTDTWEATDVSPVFCDECTRILTGGPYNGKHVKDVKS